MENTNDKIYKNAESIRTLTEELTNKMRHDPSYTPQNFCDDLIAGAKEAFNNASKELDQKARDLFQNQVGLSETAGYRSLDNVLTIAELFVRATELAREYNDWVYEGFTCLSDQKSAEDNALNEYCQPYKNQKHLPLKVQEEVNRSYELMIKLNKTLDLLKKNRPVPVFYNPQPPRKTYDSWCGMDIGRP